MPVFLEREAFRTMLFGALSCRCPVTRETEDALFAEYFGWTDPQSRPLSPILDIVDENPSRTPIHNLFEVASYGRDDPENFTISFGDAMRALGSKFHFDNVCRGLEPLAVKDVPSFLVSHMLVPVSISRESENDRAFFYFQEKDVIFDAVFFPPELEWEKGAVYGLHMGTVICRLTGDQGSGLMHHLALIPGFSRLCGQVLWIDFRDFQYYGNYCDQVRERFRRHFDV